MASIPLMLPPDAGLLPGPGQALVDRRRALRRWLLYPPLPTPRFAGVAPGPAHRTGDHRLKLQNDARTTLLQSLAGGILLLNGAQLEGPSSPAPTWRGCSSAAPTRSGQTSAASGCRGRWLTSVPAGLRSSTGAQPAYRLRAGTPQRLDRSAGDLVQESTPGGGGSPAGSGTVD